MSAKYEKQEKELLELIDMGTRLLFKLGYDVGISKKEEFKIDIKGIFFKDDYETWYTESLHVIRQIIPVRIDDFISQYKRDRRKEIDPETYTMSDYMTGIIVSRGTTPIVELRFAYPKMEKQLAILKSASKKFSSTLFDIKEIIQADLFDSELSSADDLNKKGYYRAAGAMAGVILEKHLKHICDNHQIKITKKNPSISDYIQLLKDTDVIDIPTWRHIQLLADLRNLCDHHKEKEPTKENIDELIAGVDKVIKNVF